MSFEIVLLQGDYQSRLSELAARFGLAATGRSWPDGAPPADVEPKRGEWVITWFARGWTVLASPGGAGSLDDPEPAQQLSRELGTRVALAGYERHTLMQLFDLFERGELVRSFKFYGDGEPAEEEGEPLCEATDNDEPEFAEGSIFNALDALLGFAHDELFDHLPKLCVECR